MIRIIEIKDAPVIEHICRTALGHDTTAAHLERRIEELAHDPCYYIAVYEDDVTHQVQGFIQAQRYDLIYGDDGWNIIALAVSPEARQRGIGKRLLSSLEEEAEKRGDSFIRLNCNVIRSDAHEFYQHMGYVCDKTQKRFIKQIEP